MRVVQWERIGDRRVRLIVNADRAYTVQVETIGPDGSWVDISLLADSRLRAGEAERRYQRRLSEVRMSQARMGLERIAADL
jgi:hypothetical protein